MGLCEKRLGMDDQNQKNLTVKNVRHVVIGDNNTINNYIQSSVEQGRCVKG